MSKSAVSISRTPVSLAEPSQVTRFGLIALSTDLTSEHDIFRLTPQRNTATHVTRVVFENPVTRENLMRMGPRLTAAADLIAPGEPLAAICYSCTAASVVMGDDAVTQAVQAARPGVPVVTPTGAARAAFAALGARRVSVLTPYTVAISEPFADYFSAAGLDIASFHCLDVDDDREIARIEPRSIIDAAVEVCSPGADVIFISCTALQAVDVIDQIEQKTGKPVVTSNQASAWAMSRLGGFDGHDPGGFGRLFNYTYPTM
jgi:maleate isomerase